MPVLVAVAVAVIVAVLVLIRRGKHRRLEGRDQRRGKAHRDHALDEGPACLIGRRIIHGLVAHRLLLSAVWWVTSTVTTRVFIG